MAVDVGSAGQQRQTPSEALGIDLDTLTPVERRGAYLFKRDDLFRPFPEPLNGGKVREALALLMANRERIRDACSNTVATVSSVNSPQGYLIARCAAALGMRTVVGIGVSEPDDAVGKYPAFRAARDDLGAAIVKLAGIGFNSVLQKRLERMAAREKWFPVQFGIGAHADVNARQVRNLPTDLDHLVIPCGSGKSARGILRGVARHMRPAERPKHVHVVQIAGFDRRAVIDSPIRPYNYVADRTYPYARRLAKDYEGVELDSVYESKAFAWLERAGLRGRTCFWVIGNFNAIRGR